MSQPRRSPPPEAQGPGTDALDGSVTYGVDSGVRAVIDMPRPAAERDADMEAARERASTRCGRCSAIPDDLVAAFTAARAEAYRAGREGRPL